MAPPPIPGGRGGGRGRGKGGYKGRMGKRFKKEKDGGDKPKRKKTGFGVVGVLGLFASLLGAMTALAVRETKKTSQKSDDVRRRLLSRPRAYSKHAACRMDCRKVTDEDAENTLHRGALSDRHSTPSARPCPRWALEDGRVRAVWAECRDETRLVTVIDTVTDHPCGPW